MSKPSENELIDFIGGFTHDPYAFVLAAFPWGEPGELTEHSGPREWQTEILKEIGSKLRAGYEPGAALMPVLKAVASGHGIGKSALISWLVLWALCTFEDTKVVLTANTEGQLRTKTWPEVAKWFRLCICQHWFKLLGTGIAAKDPNHEKTWRCDAVTWSENNLAAFAGLHNQGRRILILYDEASGIDDKVWEVTEGALTDEDTEIVWVAFGNPTEPVGRFYECFNRERHRWSGAQIDSRTVPGTNKKLFEEWVALYGEDHDFVRVRVRGQFPRSGSMQFIGSDLVHSAQHREASGIISDPLVIGVDVARFGDDQSVILFRKGRDARTLPVLKFRGLDTMQLAGKVAELAMHHQADAVFVDGGGVGGGVVDRLRQLRVRGVMDIQFGAKADRISFDQTQPAYANKRAEMWGNMREWLQGGAIPQDPELAADLTTVQYAFVVRDGRDAIMLERKEDMKKRGVASPDIADALALTFAYPVQQSANAGRLRGGPSLNSLRDQHASYDPFAA